MSDEPHDKKRGEGRQTGPKGSKNTKSHYESKQYNDKDSGNSRHAQDNAPYKSNDGYRQQNRRDENQYSQHKNIGYNKGIKRAGTGTEQISRRKKREPLPKISKETILERHEFGLQLSKEFQEIIDLNPQIFMKEPFLPVTIEFGPLDIPNDEGLNPKPNYNATGTTTKEPTTSKVEQETFKPEKGSKGWIDWDAGDGKDIFNELDMKNIDDQLRGKKKQQNDEKKDEEKGSKKEEKKTEEPIPAADVTKETGSAVQKEEPQNKEIEEDEGEYSNIDKIFEQKMKEKQLEFNPEEEDYGLQPEESPTKNEQGLEEDNPPVWEEFNAEDIKKDAESMESLFIGTTGPSRQQQKSPQGFSDPYAGQNYSEYSTDTSREMGQKGDAGRNPYASLQQQQQQQQLLYQQQLMKQNLNKQTENFGYSPMNQGSQMGNMNMQTNRPIPTNPNFVPLQQNPTTFYNQQMYQQQMPTMKQNPTTIGLSKQIPVTQTNKVFKFFCRDDYEKKLWFYKDFQDRIQGPFSAKEMDEWYDNKLLPPNLLITYGENNNFKTLADLVKYINSNSGKSQTQPQPQPTMPKQGNTINFATISLAQMAELCKNPDFLAYAQATGLNLQQIINNIKEREQMEKYNAMNKGYGYNQGGYPTNNSVNGYYDSQGVYYPSNTQGFTVGNIPTNQPINKGGFGQSPVGTADYGYNKQGPYQGYGGVDYKQQQQSPTTFSGPSMSGTASKGYYPMQTQKVQQPMQQQYPMQQQQQFSNQGYPTALSLSNAVLQGQAQRPQQSYNPSQGGVPDMMTDQLKSMLGLGGAMGDVMKGTESKKNEEALGPKFNPADFPAFDETYK